VHRVLVNPIPLRFSLPMGEQAYFDPPVPEHDVDAEVPPTVPDAQSAPNDVAHHSQEIPLT
jgi:isopenicillin N synthase-like dioxygenase